ncbi:helix-turn-helix transcriptional regulator [Streptomyces tricolor]|nr:helix-turn-helix transcriptional regulator [Streptomyces tricolor]
MPGLRREEIAQLAGVSVDYYVRLERGRRLNVSETVLDAISRALRPRSRRTRPPVPARQARRRQAPPHGDASAAGPPGAARPAPDP